MAKKQDFESALNELEAIVHTMEEGNLPLKDALSSFEKGINLINYCNQELEAFEKKIEILMEENGKKKGVKFDLQNFDSNS